MGLQSPHFGSILAVTGIGGLAKEHILIITLIIIIRFIMEGKYQYYKIFGEFGVTVGQEQCYDRYPSVIRPPLFC